MLNKLSTIPIIFAAFTGYAFASDTFRLDDPGGNIWYNSYTSVYVTPYTATDLTTHKSLSLFCVDFNHSMDVGLVWTADIVPLTSSSLTSLYYAANVPSNWKEFSVNRVSAAGTGTISMTVSGPPADPPPLTRYIEGAYLFSQSMAAIADAKLHPANAAKDADLERIYNIAAWTLFISEPPENIAGFTKAINTSGYGNAVYNAVQAAQAAVANHSFTGRDWYAVTPDPKSGSNLLQEFLVYRPYPVPEPSAILLFGTIVCVLAWNSRRKRAA